MVTQPGAEQLWGQARQRCAALLRSALLCSALSSLLIVSTQPQSCGLHSSVKREPALAARKVLAYTDRSPVPGP